MLLLIKEIMIGFLILGTFVGFCILIMTLISYLRSKKRQFMIINFSNYLVALEYSQEKAYDMIHKDRILIYSAEGVKIDDKDFKIISRDYAHLVFQLMGNVVKDELLELYGLESLTLNMMEYFNTRYEDDEIRKESIETMMDKDSLIEEDKKYGQSGFTNK